LGGEKLAGPSSNSDTQKKPTHQKKKKNCTRDNKNGGTAQRKDTLNQRPFWLA